MKTQRETYIGHQTMSNRGHLGVTGPNGSCRSWGLGAQALLRFNTMVLNNTIRRLIEVRPHINKLMNANPTANHVPDEPEQQQ